MSEIQPDGGENPLLREGQYSGKIYWINVPDGYELHLENLRDELNNRSFYEDISDLFDDDDSLYIPEVFKENGEIVQTTSIENVRLAQTESDNILLGDIVLDDANKVEYRNREILILDTTKANFLIFQHEGIYYLAVLAKREVAEAAATMLRMDYDEFGSTINTTRIGPNAIEDVRESLNAKLKDTIIADYPEKKLTSVQMTGEQLEEDDTFQRERERGKVKNYMFQTDKLDPEDHKTILISRDGLIRIYSNSTISTYLRLLRNHVLPNMHRDWESEPSVGMFEELAISEKASIYREVRGEE